MKETVIRFRNETEELVSLHWIDDDGTSHFFAEVLPGSTLAQPAAVGKPWHGLRSEASWT